MAYASCPSCDFMIEIGWETCRFCEARLDALPTEETEAAPVQAAPQRQQAQHVRPRRPTNWGRIVTLLLVGALLAAGGVVVKQKVFPAKPYPSRWDPRITSLVRFVEREHKMPFKHPVHIAFVSPAAFKAEFEKANEPTGDDRDEAEIALTGYQAVGLANAKVNPGMMDPTVAVLAFYEPSRMRMVIKGGAVTPQVASTVVHELTHALQDQYFDLGLLAYYPVDAEGEMLRALAEGDARRMEYRYQEQLASGEAGMVEDEAEKIRKEIVRAARKSSGSGLPAILDSFAMAPYDLGWGLAEALVADDGEARLADAFLSLPDSAESVLDPMKLINGEEAKLPELAPLERGAKLVGARRLGAVWWYVMLASRIDPHRALEAADGWGGDTALMYTKKGRSCVNAHYVGDTSADVAQLAGALGEWAAAMPPGSSQVRQGAEGLWFQSCESGAALPKRGPEVLAVPAFRSAVLGMALGQMPPELAACLAGELTRQSSVEFLTTEKGPEPAWVADPTPVLAACGVA